MNIEIGERDASDILDIWNEMLRGELRKNSLWEGNMKMNQKGEVELPSEGWVTISAAPTISKDEEKQRRRRAT